MLLLVNHTLVQIGLFKLFNCLSWHFSTERLTQESRMTSVECSTKAGWLSLSALRKQDGCRWVPYESRMAVVECSTKAGWLSLSALRKQDGFRWVPYESRMAVVECPTKAGWLSLSALRKQDGFRWVPYESRMAVVECSTKAGWLSFRALRKPFKKRVNRDNTEFRDKIAYVGGPSCRRRPWPVVERRSRAPPTSATLGSP